LILYGSLFIYDRLESRNYDENLKNISETSGLNSNMKTPYKKKNEIDRNFLTFLSFTGPKMGGHGHAHGAGEMVMGQSRMTDELDLPNYFGHTVPGSIFVFYGIRWIYCSLYRYYLCKKEQQSGKKNPRIYESSISYTTALWPGVPFDSLIGIIGSMIGFTG